MIMGMKNNQAAVQTICRERGLNTVGMRQKKKQMPEILNKMWQGEERSQRRKKRIKWQLFNKREKMDCTGVTRVNLYIVAY